jgi:hypothetical protein
LAANDGSEPFGPYQRDEEVNKEQQGYNGGKPSQSNHFWSFADIISSPGQISSQAGTQANIKAKVAKPNKNIAGSQITKFTRFPFVESEESGVTRSRLIASVVSRSKARATGGSGFEPVQHGSDFQRTTLPALSAGIATCTRSHEKTQDIVPQGRT